MPAGAGTKVQQVLLGEEAVTELRARPTRREASSPSGLARADDLGVSIERFRAADKETDPLLDARRDRWVNAVGHAEAGEVVEREHNALRAP